MRNFAYITLTTIGILVIQACAITKNEGYGDYSGEGGMLAYDIKPEAYQYHYDKGFTGVDAVGWDSNLQFAWSRIGAALTCNIPVNTKNITQKLVAAYGKDEITHEMNGYQFHAMQSARIPDFCNKQRVEEIKKLIPQMEKGNFEKRF